MTKAEYVMPQSRRIGRNDPGVAELVELEDELHEAVRVTAEEWAAYRELVTGVKPDFWHEAIPQTLHDLIETYGPKVEGMVALALRPNGPQCLICGHPEPSCTCEVVTHELPDTPEQGL